MARTVKDAASYILQVIAGVDNYTFAISNNGTLADYISALNCSALDGARIGVAANLIEAFTDPVSVTEIRAFDAAVSLIADAGATIVPTPTPPRSSNISTQSLRRKS